VPGNSRKYTSTAGKVQSRNGSARIR
jgi:hypothetical protein